MLKADDIVNDIKRYSIEMVVSSKLKGSVWYIFWPDNYLMVCSA